MTKDFDINTITGLSEHEAAQRLKEEGSNELPTTKKRSLFAIACEVAREPTLSLAGEHRKGDRHYDRHEIRKEHRDSDDNGANAEIQGISQVDEKGRLSGPHVVCSFFSSDYGAGRGSPDG